MKINLRAFLRSQREIADVLGPDCNMSCMKRKKENIFLLPFQTNNWMNNFTGCWAFLHRHSAFVNIREKYPPVSKK